MIVKYSPMASKAVATAAVRAFTIYHHLTCFSLRILALSSHWYRISLWSKLCLL